MFPLCPLPVAMLGCLDTSIYIMNDSSDLVKTGGDVDLPTGRSQCMCTTSGTLPESSLACALLLATSLSSSVCCGTA